MYVIISYYITITKSNVYQCLSPCSPLKLPQLGKSQNFQRHPYRFSDEYSKVLMNRMPTPLHLFGQNLHGTVNMLQSHPPIIFFFTSPNKGPHMNVSSTKSVPLKGYEWIQLSIRGKGLYTYGLLELKRSCLEAMALTKCALPVTSLLMYVE